MTYQMVKNKVFDNIKVIQNDAQQPYNVIKSMHRLFCDKKENAN